MTVRIGTTSRIGAAQPAGRIPSAGRDPEPNRAEPAEPTRALVVLDGGRRESPRDAGLQAGARPNAGFVAQLIVADDPSLRPSRLERTRAAAALYARTARRFA